MTVFRATVAILLIAITAACTGQRLLPAPPRILHEQAEVAGFSGVRVWGDEPAKIPDVIRREFFAQTRARAAETPGPDAVDVLVLSGGGSDGAFGAGLLRGWSDRGDRPEFTFVTGISAGALIAPFAFLGSDYDDDLEEFIVNSSTDEVLELTILRGIFRGFSLTDNTRLRGVLEFHITPEFVTRLATEHARGRRLWIGTTNLDAQRPVIWDIGAIASRGGPDARKLIVDVMLASAAIPGAFPPILFEVDAVGQSYSELHVDGGVTQQLFFFPFDIKSREIPPDIGAMIRRGTMYVVRNTKLQPDYAPVSPGIVQIAGRSVSTLIKFGGRNDILALERQAAAVGIRLKVTAVPRGFALEERELFDPVYMGALFRVGAGMIRDGDPWIHDYEPEPRPQPIIDRTARRGG